MGAQPDLRGRAFELSQGARRFRVLDAGTPEGLAAWREVWLAWPKREVMAHPEYARLFARPCDRVVALLGQGSGRNVLFPLILRPLSAEPWARPGEGRWDATSPYGYGGPFAWGSQARDDTAFWQTHADWCEQEGIVSTFVRLSLFPEQLAALPGQVEGRSSNVVVRLEAGPHALWRGYENQVRRWVRTAERAGLEVEVDREGVRLDEFRAVYTHTMQRRHADNWYLFSRSFFQSITERLRGQFAFFHTLSCGRVVSSELVLYSRDYAYSFLGGTLVDSYPLGPNYLLKHRSFSWASAEGKKACVLGGGNEPDDGLLRYKRTFARRGEVPFRVVCMTHDERANRQLVSDRAGFHARRGEVWLPRAEFFPRYRA